jgi:hypothetical protein
MSAARGSREQPRVDKEHARPWQKYGYWLRFVAFFIVLKLIMDWVEEFPSVQRALIPGADIAMMRTDTDSARRTSVIGITSDDVATHFAGQRPVPPESLLAVVAKLVKLEPRVLVVDVFTEGATYADSSVDSLFAEIRNSNVQIVWAQAADTSAGGLLRVLGGRANVPGRIGLAAMLAEPDGLVRRVRMSFQRGDAADDVHLRTLASAAIAACLDSLGGTDQPNVCAGAKSIPTDTSSVALRSYLRGPTFYTLGDALMSAGSGTDAFRAQVLVLGFVDGSDQVATPYGIATGPRVVADAIETLMDDRGLLRRPPRAVSWLLDFIGGLIVMLVYIKVKNKDAQALATLTATIAAYVGARLIAHNLGYWTSFLPVMIGIWADRLVDHVRDRKYSTPDPLPAKNAAATAGDEAEDVFAAVPEPPEVKK